MELTKELPQKNPIDRPIFIRLRDNFLDIAYQERTFVTMLGIFFFVAGAFYEHPHIAMWVGFVFAGYSAVANDSIQTIGTFIASNKDKKWWQLWLFMGAIFLVTVYYSWTQYSGDVSYQRLASKGFKEAPTSFSFLQVAAPLFLMILTRLRMPVSTTFLLLSCFATSGSSIQSILTKSLSGYFLAFFVAIVFWRVCGKWMQQRFQGPAHAGWRVAQWVISGLLWSVWIMQDAANIAVYLPRSLSWGEFLAFAGVIFFGLGLLFRMGGERIQQVVDEKTDVVDVRSATVLDLIYAGILYFFKMHSNVPMSTTWVFLGILAGRELAITLARKGEGRSFRETWRIIGKDVMNATIGLLVSLILAMAINEKIRQAIWNSVVGS